MQRKSAFWWFMAAPLFLYGLWAVYPTLATIVISFTDWDGVTPKITWVGFENYIFLFADKVFRISLVHNLLWVLVFLVVPVSLGLLLALGLNLDIRYKAILRATFFLPMALSFIVIAVMWAWIYQPRLGLLNAFIGAFYGLLQNIGLPVDPESAKKISWLGDPNLARWSVMVPAIWRETGYMMILYLAGLQGLDKALLDAAKVDGASGWKLFRHIIFPLLNPITSVVIIIAIADSLRVFDVVFIMTKGGPIRATEVLSTYMYKEAFTGYQMGYGAAIAVVLFALCVVIIAIYLRMIARQEQR